MAAQFQQISVPNQTAGHAMMNAMAGPLIHQRPIIYHQHNLTSAQVAHPQASVLAPNVTHGVPHDMTVPILPPPQVAHLQASVLAPNVTHGVPHDMTVPILPPPQVAHLQASVPAHIHEQCLDHVQCVCGGGQQIIAQCLGVDEQAANLEQQARTGTFKTGDGV
eukprot:1160559-Pelagomonas_calceolata.AAC.1